MNDHATTNLRWCFGLVDGLAASGARHAVISPGSRSTPLVLACEQHPLLRIHTHIDERSAGFFALGLARKSQQPCLLVATSGSAPAHWYPAVIEASQSLVPLLLLSADRPPELQGWNANQTIDQTRLFGVQVRAFHDPGPAREGQSALRTIRTLGRQAARQTRWPRPGPVHINLPLREPLVPDRPITLRTETGTFSPEPPPRLALEADRLQALAGELNQGRGLIVCGPMAEDPNLSPAVSALAAGLECPILADPLSGLRCGGSDRSRIFTRYDAFLRPGNATVKPGPDWVLRLGAPPVSKTLLEFLDRQDGASQILVSPYGDWPDPLQRSREPLIADPARLCADLLRQDLQPGAASWMAQWRRREQLAARCCPQTAPQDPVSEDGVIAELLATLPADALLFSGNSLPIRQLDSWCAGRTQPLRIFGNRGASGIDGNVSTLLGLAAAGARPAVGLLGDLALVHDSNGLLAAPGLQAVIIVFNNGGGGIFGYLPQAGLENFERHWLTPSGLDLSRLANLHRLSHQRVRRQDEFGPALNAGLGHPGVSLIEVMLDRELSRQRHLDYWQSVAEQIG